MAFEDFWFSKTEEPVGASLRFSGAQYLSRSIAVAGDLGNWSFYAWVKGATLGVNNFIFAQQAVTSFNYDGALVVVPSGVIQANNKSNFAGPIAATPGLYRDPGAWYHVGMTFSSGTLNVYVNGVLVATDTAAGGGPINSTLSPMYIGVSPLYGGYLNGYLSDAFFVSGQTLLPTALGYFNPNGVWVPLEFTTVMGNVVSAGGFGTNGFALRFESQYFNSGTLVWEDQSGNGNDFTANWNCQVGVGAGTDITVDGPVTNYATINPLVTSNAAVGGLPLNLTNANLGVPGQATSPGNARATPSTVLLPSGKKYYMEFTVGYAGVDNDHNVLTFFGQSDYNTYVQGGTNNGIDAGNYVSYVQFGRIYTSTTSTAVVPAWAVNDVLAIAVDTTAATAGFYKNGSLLGTYPITPETQYYVGGSRRGGTGATDFWNFGQLPFVYTIPPGFDKLDATSLAAATIPNGSTGFQALLAPGASILSTAQAAFSNGLWWVKDRVNANEHQLVDSVRGAANAVFLPSNAAQAAYTAPTGNSVAWCWEASTAFSNPSGTNGATIASTGLTNAATGFSIVQWTSNSSADGRIYHNLGATPSFLIQRYASIATSQTLASYLSNTPGTYVTLNLNLNAAGSSGAIVVPTSTTFSNDGAGPGAVMIGYLWAPIAGYSSFGEYTGNNSADGPFVYTGMKPAFVILKASSTGGASWEIYDNVRNTYNPETLKLSSDTTAAESTINGVDFLSNGFKIRTTNANLNTSAVTYFYAAFAENPFGGSNVAPVTAR